MLGQEHEHPPAITIPPVPAQTYIHHTTLSPRPKIILIGDSITELGSSDPQGWVASLAIRYNRRADVANRGMNGYNSRWGLAALPLILEEMMGPQSAAAAAAFSLLGDCCVGGASDTQIITNTDSNGEQCLQDNQAAASEKQKQQHSHPQYTFIIGYGANDSCLPESGYSRHHVPLEEYSSNLKSMIQIIQTWSAEKTVAVALLTPPPANTEVLKGSRDNESVTKLYAEACIHLASEMGVPVVDVWTGMQLPISKGRDEGKTSSFESNQQWKTDYLSDGLHLTPMGNYRLYELVIEMLDRQSSLGGDGEEESCLGLGLAVKQLPRSYPDHSTVDAEDPQKTFGTGDNFS